MLSDDGKRDFFNEDIESLLENIRLGKQPNDDVETYFIPQLTEEEMESVKRKDPDYLGAFPAYPDPDIDEKEMKMSESDSKFCLTKCIRRTFECLVHESDQSEWIAASENVSI